MQYHGAPQKRSRCSGASGAHIRLKLRRLIDQSLKVLVVGTSPAVENASFVSVQGAKRDDSLFRRLPFFDWNITRADHQFGSS